MNSAAPLADRLRPQETASFAGQQHLLNAEMPLARMLSGALALHSMIFWGPPGCGKTTLARLLANTSQAKWYQLSAVTAGIKEVRAVIHAAEQARTTESGDSTALPQAQVLFVDEVHHFNKTQQDAFLPHIESGLFIFVGATTENPSFEINNALLSRLTVYPLKPLTEDALQAILKRALATAGKQADEDASALLLQIADGDARRLINIVECAAGSQNEGKITTAGIAAAAGGKQRRFDKGGDYFYDQISAFHKSVRGSDPDAALYWLCRMLDGGADGRYLARRLIRIASEDIGLADPKALALALAADDSYRRLGTPEGELALAQAAVYLAAVPKSDAVYSAYKKMRAFIAKDQTRQVPAHLQNAPTALMRQQGHGTGYRHAHEEKQGYAAGVHYFPDDLPALRYYCPTERGLEKKIAERLAYLRNLDKNNSAKKS